MKRVYLSAIIAILFILCSCTNASEECLYVTSADYPQLTQLKAAEFDKQIAEDMIDPSYPYQDFTCYVTLKDGILCVENKKELDTSFLQTFRNGYFAGVDVGELGGWVTYTPAYAPLPEVGETIQVTAENCRGIVSIDGDNGYLLTGSYGSPMGTGSAGCLRKLTWSTEAMEWTWDILASFSGCPQAYTLQESGELYIVTDQALYQYSHAKGLMMLAESPLLAQIGVNSIVLLDQKIYCGSYMGIWSFELTTQTQAWYPIDYEAVSR